MIVHGVLSLDVGGLERIVASLAARQKAHVICLTRRGALADDLESRGVTVHCLNQPPGRQPVPQAEALFKSLSPTVLHTHQLGAAYHLAPAAKRAKLRVVHTEHGDPFARAQSALERLKLRWVARKAMKPVDAVAAVSEEIAASVARYRTVTRSKITVVPNGIEVPIATRTREEVRKLFGIPAGAFVVGTVGRLVEVKRQWLLLKSVAALPQAHALLVGDGPERASLQSLAESLGIAERVTFAGYQPQPFDLLQTMDVFCLTSRSEGFPVSLLEAWAAKLPVVVSAVGGLPKIVTNEFTGLLVPGDDAKLFSQSLQRIQADSTFASRLGHAGHHALLANYTLDAMLGRYQSLYQI